MFEFNKQGDTKFLLLTLVCCWFEKIACAPPPLFFLLANSCVSPPGWWEVSGKYGGPTVHTVFSRLVITFTCEAICPGRTMENAPCFYSIVIFVVDRDYFDWKDGSPTHTLKPNWEVIGLVVGKSRGFRRGWIQELDYDDEVFVSISHPSFAGRLFSHSGGDGPHSVQFSSVAQSCPTLCDPMNPSTPGLPVYHQLPEFTQTHVHQVADAIQPSHPLSSPFPPAPNPSQHQSLFQWVNSSHEVAKVLEFQL